MQPAGTGSIGDFVWLDTNRDEISDPVEQPLPGVTVSLYRIRTQRAIDVGEPLIGTDMTDAERPVRFHRPGHRLRRRQRGQVSGAGGYRQLRDLAHPYSGGPATSTIDASMSTTTGTPANSLSSVSLYTGQATVSNTDFGYNWSGTIGDTVSTTATVRAQNGGEPACPTSRSPSSGIKTATVPSISASPL